MVRLKSHKLQIFLIEIKITDLNRESKLHIKNYIEIKIIELKIERLKL